jgi:hypothetical protein
VGRTPQLPAVEIAAEDYRRIARLAKGGEVRIEIDSRVHFEDTDSKAYNVVAEIPGSDARSGFVMAGARRSGSREVRHVVCRRLPDQRLAEFSQLSAYFNLDNGSGKIRGIYAEGNLAAVPILREWLGPLASMGTTAVVAEPTDWTDHILMNRIGLPAFQFIQDPLDYESRVHHTDLDTFDHLRIDDLRQASLVLATVLLDAANSDTPMPRVPVPTEPRVTDPFHYDDPAQR